MSSVPEVEHPCNIDGEQGVLIFSNYEAYEHHMQKVHKIDPNVPITHLHTEVRSTSVKGGQKGVKLERFDLIPAGPLAELARHYGVGAKKYAEHQWRQGYEWSKSIAAIGRHYTLFMGGEDYDRCPSDGEGCSFVTHEGEPFEDYIPGQTCYNHTGSHHMVAVAWHSFLLLEFKDTHPDLDDRWKVA